MKNNVFRKGFVVGMIALFIGATVLSTSESLTGEKTPFKDPISRGYIQGLIDNASVGDTIYIPNGIYYENIIINKSISLIGEDKNNTIIDGGGIGDVVHVLADWVNISGFTIRNSGEEQYLFARAGIQLNGTDNCSIKNNIIIDNQNGIYLGSDFGIRGSTNSKLYGNIIKFNKKGICLNHNYNSLNKMYENEICMNDIGIYLDGSNNYNEIFSNNIISNVQWGVLLGQCICGGVGNKVYHNNFIYNGEETGQAYDCAGPSNPNFWDDGYPSGGNFWSDYNGTDDDGDGIGDTPYIIDGSPEEKQDNYPLMKPTANVPPDIPSIDGPSTGKPGDDYEYTVVTTDTNGDHIYYWIDWGDDSNTGWIGPVESNEEMIVSHSWAEKGDFTIQVKAKDEFGAKSDWGTLDVTMPVNSVVYEFPLIYFILEHFPNIFPILRLILGL